MGAQISVDSNEMFQPTQQPGCADLGWLGWHLPQCADFSVSHLSGLILFTFINNFIFVWCGLRFGTSATPSWSRALPGRRLFFFWPFRRSNGSKKKQQKRTTFFSVQVIQPRQKRRHNTTEQIKFMHNQCSYLQLDFSSIYPILFDLFSPSLFVSPTKSSDQWLFLGRFEYHLCFV